MGHLVLLLNRETVLRTHLTSPGCGFTTFIYKLTVIWNFLLSNQAFFSSGLNPHLSQTSLCVKESEVPHHHLFDSRCLHWRIPPLWQVRGDSQRWMTDKRRWVTKRLVSICAVYGAVYFFKSEHVGFMFRVRFSLWDMQSLLTSRGLLPYCHIPQRLWGIHQCLQLLRDVSEQPEHDETHLGTWGHGDTRKVGIYTESLKYEVFQWISINMKQIDIAI